MTIDELELLIANADISIMDADQIVEFHRNVAKLEQLKAAAAKPEPGTKGATVIVETRSPDGQSELYEKFHHILETVKGKRESSTHDVGTIRKSYDYEITDDMSPKAAGAVIDAAVTAHVTKYADADEFVSAACCAPLVPVLTLQNDAEATDYLNEPTVGVPEGYGVTTTPGVCFDQVGLPSVFTCADAAAGTFGVGADGFGNGTAGAKPCSLVPCPDWQQHPLDPVVACVTSNLLDNAAYPQLLAKYLHDTEVLLQDQVNVYNLRAVAAQAAAGTGAYAPLAASPTSPAGALNAALSLAAKRATDVRKLAGLGRRRLVKIVLPAEVLDVFRVDLGYRTGWDGVGLTDEHILRKFAAFHLRPEFVRGLLPVTPPTAAWPASFPIYAYPLGAVRFFERNVIRVTNLYSPETLSQNQVTSLFYEAQRTVAFASCAILGGVVNVCPDGATAEPVDISCTENVAAA